MSQSEADPATDSAEGGAGAVDFSQDDVEVLQKRKKEFDEHVAETAELTKRHYEAPILLSKEQQSILETKKVLACCTLLLRSVRWRDQGHLSIICLLIYFYFFLLVSDFAPLLLRLLLWNASDELEDGEREIFPAACRDQVHDKDVH